MATTPPSLTPLSHRAIVVGATSGIGRACVMELVRRGWTVAALGRREDLLQRLSQELNNAQSREAVIPVEHDVLDYDSIPALFDALSDRMGGCDLVLYAAGVMTAPGENEYPNDADAAMIRINLLGAIGWCNQAADLFTRLGQGTILGISSIAGERGRRRAPVYGASKAGLTHYLEALRNRLSRHNVRVVTIKPGYIDTEMVAGVPNPLWLISAEEAARRIVDAVYLGPETLYVPRRWGLVAGILHLIPSEIFRHLNV